MKYLIHARQSHQKKQFKIETCINAMGYHGAEAEGYRADLERATEQELQREYKGALEIIGKAEVRS